MDILKTFQELEDNLASNDAEIELLKKKKNEEQQRQAELKRQEAERTSQLQQQKAAQEYQLQQQKANQAAELQRQEAMERSRLQRQIADRINYRNSIKSYISTVYSNFEKTVKIFTADQRQEQEKAYNYFCDECKKFEQWDKYKSNKDSFQNPGDEYCTDREYYDTPLARFSARISNNKMVALKENLRQVEKNIKKRKQIYEARDMVFESLHKPVPPPCVGFNVDGMVKDAIADARNKVPEPRIRMESLFYRDGRDQLKDNSAELFAEIDVEIFVLEQSSAPKPEMLETIKVLKQMIQEVKESRRIISDTKKEQEHIDATTDFITQMKPENIHEMQNRVFLMKNLEEENKKKVEEINRIIGII